MATSKAAKVQLVVTRSFGTLNQGDRFEVEKGDAWAEAHMKAGLLKEADGGAGTDQAGEG